MISISGEPRLKFSDDPMFKRVMFDEIICKGVLERLLGRPVESVSYHSTEHERRVGVHTKTIRMDSYLVESGGHLFDVEMQTSFNSKLPMRFRGYQSILDASFLKPGQRYSTMMESFIFFICTEDPFGAGKAVYRIERQCVDEPDVKFDCRAHWVALNASAYSEVSDDEDLANPLRYVYTNEVPAGDELIEAIDAEVERNNDDREWVAMLMDSISVAEEEAMIRGEEKGLQRGMQKGMQEGENRYAKLVDMLMDAGRFDDLKRANSDPEARACLFEELGL